MYTLIIAMNIFTKRRLLNVNKFKRNFKLNKCIRNRENII